jgi:hypothetical protein
MHAFSLLRPSFLVVAGHVLGQPLSTPSERMKPEAASNRLADPVIAEDESMTAKARIVSQASELLKQCNYRALDAMAGQLRRAGKTFARGEWPIVFFFAGVAELPKGSTDADWQARIHALRDWFEQDPDCVTPRIALARGLYEYAWEARGEGWASEVTNDGWRLFGERITEAHRILYAAETLGQICPVYYSTRLRVALVDGTSRDEYEDLFKKSVEAFPTFAPFYFTKAYYLLPRWHGEEGEWEQFAATTADRLGGEDGDVLYAQFVWAMHDNRVFGNILKESAVEWPRAKRGFEALCCRYPNSISAPSEYCSISGFAPKGARGLMRSLFPRLGNRVDLTVWKTTERFAEDRAWAFGP